MSGWGASLVGYSSTVSLLNSLRMEFVDGAIFVVGPTVKYAVYHELGTSKMQARPFARPAAERVQANMESKIDEVLEDVDVLEADEDELARGAALAVQNEMKRIADAKDIRDTGDLIASITIEKVS